MKLICKNEREGKTTTKVVEARRSNLELMRIILMLFIIMHHSVVNSGVMFQWDLASMGGKGLFLTLWGMWGKAAINAFVLITGYFMCVSSFKPARIIKMLATVFFWEIVLDFCFIAVGRMSLRDMALGLLYPLWGINKGFTASFIAMYLFVPFLNRLIAVMDKEAYRNLVVLLLTLYVGVGTVVPSSSVFNELGWYIALYLLAGYIRIYPAAWMSDRRVAGFALLATVAGSVVTVLALSAIGRYADFGSPTMPYYFMVDSQKLFAFLTGLACFLFFNNLNMPFSRTVNIAASTVFGVLLIHSGSDAMREFLWVDIFNIARAYRTMSFPMLMAYMAIIPLVVFSICSLLDLLRQRYFERTVLKGFILKGRKP